MGKSLITMLDQMSIDETAYKEGKIGKWQTLIRKDDAGNLIREKALEYYGKSF